VDRHLRLIRVADTSIPACLTSTEGEEHPEHMTRELADEDQALSDVVDRLEERFPSRDRSEIERAVADAHSHFERAKVRDFVPVLVEREARARLEHPIQ